MSAAIKLSIIIVAYQSRSDLERCFPSLQQQDLHGVEIIIVNNSPQDDVEAWLRQQAYIAPDTLRYIANPSNDGYAGGNIVGLAEARGDSILILNPDTVLSDGALARLQACWQQHPRSLITPKLLSPDGSINACGLQWHYTGISSCRGLGEDAANYHGLHEVPLISGAAFMASAEVFEELGGFDASYFMYHEDSDISLRARLLGMPLYCAADSLIYHYYQQRLNANKLYYLERNRLLTLLKVLQTSTLWRMAPALLLSELATWGYALLKGGAYLKARGRVYRFLWRERAQWQASRRLVQGSRQQPDALLLASALSALPFEQLIDNPKLASTLTALTTPLYQLLRPRWWRYRRAAAASEKELPL